MFENLVKILTSRSTVAGTFIRAATREVIHAAIQVAVRKAVHVAIHMLSMVWYEPHPALNEFYPAVALIGFLVVVVFYWPD